MSASRRSAISIERLRQRVERDALAVGEASPAQDGRSIAELVDERGHQPRLAHASDAEDREELARVVADRPLERAPQERELAFAADHGCVEVSREPGRAGGDLEQAERGHRIGLPLREPARRSARR